MRLAARAALLLLLAASASARRRLLDGYAIGTLGGVVPRPNTAAWLQAPGKLASTMASCSMSEFSGCKSTMAPVFAASAPLINQANYPAIAKAYIAATSWFCSQFSNDTCAWPCQFNLGVGCTIAGHLYYQPWTCPSSLGFGWNHCSQPPQQASKPQCLANPMCSWNDAAVSGPNTKCSSTFASTLTDQQKLFVFGSLYFSTMPRELHGCCKGSTYTYQLDNFCNAAFSNPDGTGSTSPEACAKVPGCAYDAWNVEGCYPTVQAQVGLQFAYKPSDPLAAPLKKLAGECAAIKDAAACNSYKPVAVDPAKISHYLDRHMVLSLNQPVTDQICPLPSRPPPWV